MLGSLFVAFSLGGAVFGMGEETIALLALLLPLVDRLGLPRESAVMCTYMVSQIGFGTSWMNPFSVAVAQGIAEVPVLSGAGFRIAMWATFTLIGAIFTVRYALRRRVATGIAQPHVNAVTAVDTAVMPAMNRADRLILLAVLATVGWIVCGVIAWIDGRMNPNRIDELFAEGAQQLVPVALVIAVAKGMLWLIGGDADLLLLGRHTLALRKIIANGMVYDLAIDVGAG